MSVLVIDEGTTNIKTIIFEKDGNIEQRYFTKFTDAEELCSLF